MQKNFLFRAVPSYPSALYSAKTLHDIYNVPDRNRLAGENKGTYIQVYTEVKGGNCSSQKGDLAMEVSTQLSTYIKTSTIEVKIQY